MRWTLGLLLIASAGCGYRQTKMVACPETGCTQTYASRSPEGLAGPREEKVAEPLPPPTPLAPPITPLPDTEPPPPAPPVYTPSSP